MCLTGMRNAVALVTLLSVSTFTAAAQTVAAKKTYYRVRTASTLQQSTGGPVVFNAASFEAGVSPGGLATVYGTDLPSVSGVIVASSDPLPSTLGGVSVTINGISAALFSVAYANGQDQISFQVPYETPVGNGAVEVD